MRRILERSRINWTAVAELAHPATLADPPRATPRPDPAPWDLLIHPPDPRERLTEYLDAWAGMDEAAWPEANVNALYEDIIDIFRDYPEADRWYQEWRAAHPEARLS